MVTYGHHFSCVGLNEDESIETATSIQFMLDDVTNMPYVVNPSKDRLPDDAFTAEELEDLIKQTFGV